MFETAMRTSADADATSLPLPPRAKPGRLPVWGDGIVEQSLTTLWYRCDWGDVSDDELVFFLPALARPSHKTLGSKGLAHGPSRYLSKALAARLYWAVNVLSLTMPDARRARHMALDGIAQSGVITALPFEDIWAKAEAAFADSYDFRPGPRALAGWRGTAVPGARPSSARAAWLFELAVLSNLDQMLGNAVARYRDMAGLSARPMPEVSLADAVVAAIYASFNSAYIYSRYQYAHQLFMVAAWLGLLVRGRMAFICPAVAEPLVDILSRQRPDALDDVDVTGQGSCETLLRLHARNAVHHDRLLSMAVRSLASGASILVKPRDLEHSHMVKQPLCGAWNRHLAAALASRVPDLRFAS